MTSRSPIEKLIKRESDKAILVTVTTARGNRADVWFPRSQVAIEGRVIWVADWLLDKKRAEVGGIVTLDPTAAQLAAQEAA